MVQTGSMTLGSLTALLMYQYSLQGSATGLVGFWAGQSLIFDASAPSKLPADARSLPSWIYQVSTKVRETLIPIAVHPQKLTPSSLFASQVSELEFESSSSSIGNLRSPPSEGSPSLETGLEPSSSRTSLSRTLRDPSR